MLGTSIFFDYSSIIGYGVVGKSTAMAWEISAYADVDNVHIPFVSLADKNGLLQQFLLRDWFVICLPTPTVDGKQDLTIIFDWVEKIYNTDRTRAGCWQPSPRPGVIIRSTILPGTINELEKKYGDKVDFLHVPEFLNEQTALDDALEPELLLVGSNDVMVRDKVASKLHNILGVKVIQCKASEAELVKYALNGFFALKVIFGNQLWDVAREVGADYGVVKKALEQHKWGSTNGWDVWKNGYRGYGGACLPKDVDAFANKFNLDLLKQVHKINEVLVKTTICPSQLETKSQAS